MVDTTHASCRAKQLAEQIKLEVFGPAYQFCDIPERYQECSIDTLWVSQEEFDTMSVEELRTLADKRVIVNPRDCQAAAILFFKALLAGEPLVSQDKNPFKPKVGLYMVGPPGSGKTHILAAAALLFHRKLWKQLQAYVDQITMRIDQEVKRQAAPGGIKILESVRVFHEEQDRNAAAAPKVTPEEQRMEKLVAELRGQLAGTAYRPTDLVWVEFDRLYHLIENGQNQELLAQILDARLLFLDDPHPKGIEERFQLIQRIIEERYNSGKMGTFISSNLDPTDMANKQSGQNVTDLALRLRSRCEECYVTVKFTGCLDWRKVVCAREPRKVHDALMAYAKKDTLEKRKNIGLPPEPKENEL